MRNFRFLLNGALAVALLTLSAAVAFTAAQDKKEEDEKPDVIFVPTPQEVVEAMLKLGKVTKDDVVYDLGCGDGRIVLSAARIYKCKSEGFDVSSERLKECKENLDKEKNKAEVAKLVKFHKKNIFKQDLKDASVVTLYLLTELNTKLVPQLSKMKKGSRIVTQTFDIPDYQEDKKETVKTKEGTEYDIYLYTIPLKKKKGS